jgi:polyisoprenoid-binding protein YceI
MKKIVLTFVMAFATLIASAQTKKIDISKSTINWVGKKVTGEHSGNIAFKDGTLLFKGEKLKGGKFIVNMASINTTDLTGEYKDKLDGHLKSEDFFGTEKFPTALLAFKKIGTISPNVYKVTADLTIKGITQPIVFEITISKNTATSKLIVNRTKYDIKYGSGSFFDNLGDKTIADDFELNVLLTF